MGLRFISNDEVTALYDSVSGWAFGPTFPDQEAAERFLNWTETQGVRNGDVRSVPLPELDVLWSRYCSETAES